MAATLSLLYFLTIFSAATLSLLYFLIIFSVSNICLALAQDENQFIYNGFLGTNLSLNGSSKIHSNGLLQLTNTSQQEMGHAFYPLPIKFNTSSSSISFSTIFVFAMVRSASSDGGHGLAFVIAPSTDFSQAMSTQYLGIFNSSGKQVWDKGVSVKEYIMNKFEPGEDERALSQVIVDAISPRRKPGDVSVVEKVKEAVTSLLRSQDSSKSTVAPTTTATAIATTASSSPCVPISANAHEGQLLPSLLPN